MTSPTVPDRDYDRPNVLILSREEMNVMICRRKAQAHQFRRFQDIVSVGIPVIFQLHHKHSVYVNYNAISRRPLT